ncbi:efflux RND transporter periplasmic adaptor subunit [Planctomycetota bacterium]
MTLTKAINNRWLTRDLIMKTITTWGLIVASLLLVNGCKKEEARPEVIRPVRTMRVAEAEAFRGRLWPGRAEAVQAVDMAFEVPGQMIERPVNVGDKVKKGQVLAKLDPRDFENEVQQAQAKLKQAQAYLDRIKQAAQTGAVAKQDVTDAQAQYDVAEAGLSLKQKALADSQLIAPFDGTIAATYVENFQNVRQKQSVMRLLDMSEIEVKVDIPEQLISLVGKVRDIQVRFDAFPNNPVPATIKEVGSEASASTRTYPVTLVMTQPKEFEILPGMTGQASGWADLGEATVKGVQITASAVFEEANKYYVWVYDESSHKVKKQEVLPQDYNSAGVIVQGLEAGSLIVTAGTHYLHEGETVRQLASSTELGASS